jgi:hypothetical protein
MKRLIIGPGSMIIYSFIGVIKYLIDEGLLDDLEEISCSSTGAVLGFSYVFFKGDPTKLLEVALKAPLDTIAKPDIKNLLTRFGLIDADRFEKYFAKVTDGINPTFKELYEMNPIKLHIPTCDIVTNKTIYMSVDTTPDMKVAHAVRRSIAVPLIMTPVNRRYIDGSVREFSPFAPFLGKTDVLEIRYRFESSALLETPPKTFFQYLYTIACTFISNRQDYMFFPRIDVHAGAEFQLFNFSMSLDQKLQLYTSGYHQAKTSLPVCYRRNHDSSEEDPKSLVCSPQQCTRDLELQSEDQHHPVGDVTDEMTDLLESSSPVPLEMHQSSVGTSEASLNLDVGS